MALDLFCQKSLLAPPPSFTALPSLPQTITHTHELNIHLTIVSPAQIPNFHMISDLVTAYGKTVRSTQQVRTVGVVTGHVTIVGRACKGGDCSGCRISSEVK